MCWVERERLFVQPASVKIVLDPISSR